MSQWRTVLEEVIRDRRGGLVGYASLFAPDRSSAEDLVQEALVRVFSHPRTLRSVPSAEQYVRRAIRTAFLDQARKDKTWRGKQHLFASDETARGPEQAVQSGMDVRAALAALSPRERACVVLRYFEDLPVADIAAELGIGQGAVKRYLSDGSSKLRGILAVETDTDLDAGSESAHVSPIDQRSAR
ncbi:sigma-70 family RNA polymerase sigma factor [Actinotalea sp. K2]|uniref:RNA polymerase sigma factor n=1 Tax=Actinotalea sp. K2 TaxID=2939438 RepID=UPI002016C9BF|nr:sigma-70 family RNA polymerase sigma factor [Actinotalea sp. K2]MCL3862490.1 sigma-70 family RNA polymerase sigma factor [Actinotalea sp. K2]